MNNSMTLSKKSAAKALITAVSVAAAVALPQLFHAIGTVSGTGPAVGTALLPMHLPVILAGLIGGPAAGIIAGLASPLISSLISGMPAAALLPFMMIELGVYGAVSGLISKAKLNSFAKLLIVQLSGRAARAAAVLVSVYALGNTALTAASAVEFITAGLFGIIIQWAVIPLLADRMEDIKKLYE